jgi:hypothetical protein
MDCPRCGGPITVYELGDAVSKVCEDCSYVGVIVDHRREDTDIESWDDALNRFQTEFPESVPDGVARVDDDTEVPDTAVDDATAEDSGFQLRSSHESTTIAESVPEPGIDFPAEATRPDVLAGGDATTVKLSGADDDPAADGERTVGDTATDDHGAGAGGHEVGTETESRADKGVEPRPDEAPHDSDQSSPAGGTTKQPEEGTERSEQVTEGTDEREP